MWTGKQWLSKDQDQQSKAKARQNRKDQAKQAPRQKKSSLSISENQVRLHPDFEPARNEALRLEVVCQISFGPFLIYDGKLISYAHYHLRIWVDNDWKPANLGATETERCQQLATSSFEQENPTLKMQLARFHTGYKRASKALQDLKEVLSWEVTDLLLDKDGDLVCKINGNWHAWLSGQWKQCQNPDL